MKKIRLCNKKGFALVDNEYYEWLNKYTWYIHPHGYVSTEIKGKTILMHRLIMCASKRINVDHKNHNKFDNQKSNLRLCTQSQNLANKVKALGTTSIYKGVNFDKERQKWIAKIRINKRTVNLGRFSNQRHAAMAYDIWAKDYYGEFALLNFS